MHLSMFNPLSTAAVKIVPIGTLISNYAMISNQEAGL